MGLKRNKFQLILISIGIILFFFAITTWWLSLANPNFQIWSIILFFISIILILNSIFLTIFDLQKRIEKLELIYKIREVEGNSIIQGFDIKIISLNNWEKRIINHLKKNNGELTQTEIRNLTGLSRSNLSKHINSLVQKKMVKKEPFKRTNKIILIRNVLD